jgi:hypothetical protein
MRQINRKPQKALQPLLQLLSKTVEGVRLSPEPIFRSRYERKL